MKWRIFTYCLWLCLLLSWNFSFGQKIRLKGGILGFPHIEVDGKKTFATGKGFRLGMELKVIKKFSFQIEYEQTCLKFKSYFFNSSGPPIRYHYDEYVVKSEFRYYPKMAFEKLYLGLTTAVYTDKQNDSNDFFGGGRVWHDSGYKYGFIGGYVLKLTDKFEIEPQIGLEFDLGRYLYTDDLFGYPRFQSAVLLTYLL